MITDDLRTALSALEVAARDFDPSACNGQDAIDVVALIGPIVRLANEQGSDRVLEPHLAVLDPSLPKIEGLESRPA